MRVGQSGGARSRRVRRLRGEGQGREHQRGHGRQVRAAAARQRDRQLHEGRAARAGAHRDHRRAAAPIGRCGPGMSVKRTYVDVKQRQRTRVRWRRRSVPTPRPAGCRPFRSSLRRGRRRRQVQVQVSHRHRGDAGGGARADRHVDRQRRDPAHDGEPRRDARRDLVGVHRLHHRERDRHPDVELALGVLRTEALSHGLDPRVRRGVVLLRRGDARSAASIFWRVVQGLGGGALLSTAQATLFEAFPPKEVGIGQAMFGVGVMVGPTHRPDARRLHRRQLRWPWIFYINVPLGIIAAFMVWTYVRDSEHQERARQRRRARASCCSRSASARCSGCSSAASATTGSSRAS